MVKRFKSKWINLNDDNGARLCAGHFQGRLVVVIQGVRPRSPEYYRILNGDLKRPQDRQGLIFRASPSGANLIHTCTPNEQVFASQFTPLWPRAKFEEMSSEDFYLDLDGLAARQAKREAEKSQENEPGSTADPTSAGENLTNILNQSSYLGRNESGRRVFENLSGRFFIDDNDKIVREDEGTATPTQYLRAKNEKDLRICAAGLLRACDMGEAQKLEDLIRFSATVLSKQPDDLTQEDRDLVARAIDSAILDTLMAHGSAHAASADAAYYQEMMPGRAQLAVDSPSTPFVPAPVAIQAQRLLSTCTTLRLDGKIPPYGFGLLPDSTHVLVSGQDTAPWDSEDMIRPTWTDVGQGYMPISECDGGYLRISHTTPPDRIEAVMDSIVPGGLCLVTAGDEGALNSLGQYAWPLRTICVPPWLSLTEKPIYLSVVQRRPSDAQAQAPTPAPTATLTNWDDLKIAMDEMLRELGRTEDVAASKVATPKSENRYQRPYLARSRISPSSTMVPKNLQAPISAALSRVEQIHGPVDEFFSEEVGISINALSARFSAEQVDAGALIFHRLGAGQGFILGDETGIGKGRTIAATALRGLRQNRLVVFISDKANLFSDLARDMIDIGEWDRVRPLITNTDGVILDIMNDGEVLAQPTSATQMRRYMNGEQHNANIIFTTYSQINEEDSAKARWLREQCRDALLIADEAHVAAGSDSNIANNLRGMLDNAHSVLYSSATWAKSSRNLHIFYRALPESVNLAQISEAMASSPSFGEIFSSMLAMDGAFVRREHDLSKIDFVIEVDQKNYERNIAVQAQISEILGMMAMVSGEVNHMLQRMNAPTRQALEQAREARQKLLAAEKNATRERNQPIIQEPRTAAQEIEERAHQIRLEEIREQLEAASQQMNEASFIHANRRQELAQARAHLSELEALADTAEDDLERARSNVQFLEQAEAAMHEQLAALENSFRALQAQHGELIVPPRQENEPANAAPPQEDEPADAENNPEQAQEQDAAPATTGAGMNTSGRLFTSSFGTGGAIYSVMRRCMAALGVDHVVDKVLEDMREGRRSVIVLDETGETFVRTQIEDEIERIRTEIAEFANKEAAGLAADDSRAAAEARRLGEMLDQGAKAADIVQAIHIPTVQDLMRNLVRRLGGIRVTEVDPGGIKTGITGAEEMKATTTIGLSQLPDITEDELQKYSQGIEALNAKINALPRLPIMPIDAIRAKLSAQGVVVGEISGRAFELRQDDDNEEGLNTSKLARLVKRSRKKVDVTRTVKGFNDGSVDVVIMNKRAATGVSMHASPRFVDSRQRHLMELQPDENPATRIQLFGRVNRFDQVVPPRVSMMSTGLKSELRSIMMQNRKLVDLSANIRSSRENAAVINDVPDLLNRTGDRVCQEYLLENPTIASRLEISADQLHDASGLANFLTQRMVLLTPEHQETIYNDLKLAYEDALLENQLTRSGDQIPLHDWRAQTERQSLAWGPSENIEALSAFDGPVYLRSITFEHDYQPLQWNQIRDRIAKSTHNLLQDERVARLPARAYTRFETDEIIPMRRQMAEQQLPAEIKKNLWARDLLDFMLDYLPAESVQNNQNEGEDAQVLNSVEDIMKALNPENETPEALNTDAKVKRLPNKDTAFQALGGHWIGALARVIGTEDYQRFMVLISRSGKTAKLWCADSTKRTAEIYTLDLEAAFKRNGKEVGDLFRKRETLKKLPEDSWIFKRFDATWGSMDKAVEVLTLERATESGAAVLEAQKHMALSTTKHSTIEAALSAPEANAVKEAHRRQLFLNHVVSKLAPGVRVSIRRTNDRKLQALSAHFVDRPLLLTNVRLPEKGNESLLSHWKFHFAAPGDEKEITLSGALMIKLAGQAPNFFGMYISPNVFTRPMHWTQEVFDSWRPRKMIRNKKLLVGNAFQALQWANETKMGSPILYTDETGATHRAVEIEPGRATFLDFPPRLSHRKMIKDLFDAFYAQENQDHARQKLFTSFSGALSNMNPQQNRGDKDLLLISPEHHSMVWMVPKSEKTRVQRTLRAALNQDKAKWLLENPEATPADYPVHFSTKAPRQTDARISQVPLTITFPSTKVGRDRFIDILVASQGFQIVVPPYGPIAELARNIEREYYHSLSEPAVEEIQRQKAQRELREQRRTLLNQPSTRINEAPEPAAAPEPPEVTQDPRVDDEFETATTPSQA